MESPGVGRRRGQGEGSCRDQNTLPSHWRETRTAPQAWLGTSCGLQVTTSSPPAGDTKGLRQKRPFLGEMDMGQLAPPVPILASDGGQGSRKASLWGPRDAQEEGRLTPAPSSPPRPLLPPRPEPPTFAPRPPGNHLGSLFCPVREPSLCWNRTPAISRCSCSPQPSSSSTLGPTPRAPPNAAAKPSMPLVPTSPSILQVLPT